MKRAVVAVALLSAAAACVCTPPIRLLPTTIQSVYVPVFENLSYESGLEKDLTRFTQEELLMDGRIDVVGPGRADAMLWGRILKFGTRPDYFSRDDFPLTSRLTMVADVGLYDPLDLERTKPLMMWEGITAEYSYVSDMRRVIEANPQEAIREALRGLARQLVFTVLYTPPTPTEEAPAVRPPAPPEPVPGEAPVRLPIQDLATTASLPLEGGQTPPIEP